MSDHCIIATIRRAKLPKTRSQIILHAPLRKFRGKGRNNPWFSPELSILQKARDDAWAEARNSKSQGDWLVFKQLRNHFTSLVKKAKSDFYIDKTTLNLNDPKQFWKVVKSSFWDETTNELPACIVKGAHKLIDKSAILNYFNEHFVSSGSLFES